MQLYDGAHVLLTTFDDLESYEKAPILPMSHYPVAIPEGGIADLPGMNTDQPISWTQRVRQGRSFVITIGHDIDTFRRIEFIRMFPRRRVGRDGRRSRAPTAAASGASCRRTTTAATSLEEHLVVMGVSGSGKTTVGRALAAALGREFAEGDFHPAANVAKMAAGVLLDDADRAPWLDAVVEAGAVRACGGQLLGAQARLAGIGCAGSRRASRSSISSSTPRRCRSAWRDARGTMLGVARRIPVRGARAARGGRARVVVDAALPVDAIVARVTAA